MALLTFNGSQGSSWDDTDNYTPTGAAPGAGDSVYFDEVAGSQSVLGPTGGNIDLDLDLIQIDDGYTGDIGTSGTPVLLCCDKIVHRGGGTLYWQDSVTSGAFTDQIIIDSSRSSTGGLAASLTGKQITNLAVQRGLVHVLSTLVDDFTAHVSGGELVIQAGAAGTGSSLKVTGGVVTSSIDLATVEVVAGSVTQDTTEVGNVTVYGGIWTSSYRTDAGGNVITGFLKVGGPQGAIADFTTRSKQVTIAGNLILNPGGVVRQAYAGQVVVTGQTIYAGGSLTTGA